LSSDRLNPFSYVILTLVGRHGAGPHDLRRNAEQGRVFWEAAPSQWYAEPKRLAKLGYLDAEKLPGRTRERTHYTLTEKGRAALEEWARTPVALPRMQHESIVRLLSADLVPAEAVLEGLGQLRTEIETQLGHLASARARWSETAPHRVHLLSVNERYAERLLRLQLDWLDEAEATLRTHG
jgi:PadR family transcriptional regulator, regulatory protein AphA